MTKDEFKRLRHDIRCILRGIVFYQPMHFWGSQGCKELEAPINTLTDLLIKTHPMVHGTLYQQRPTGFLRQPIHDRIDMRLNLIAGPKQCEEWRKRVAV